MGNPSQTETESGSGRNQQQVERPKDVSHKPTPMAQTTDGKKAANGGAHPPTVKNR